MLAYGTQGRRRRHARARRREVRGQECPSSTRRREAVKQDRRRHLVHLRAAARRGRRDPRGGRRGLRARHLHHRGHPGDRHGARCAAVLEGKPTRASSGRTAPASSRRASARSASCRATSTSPATSASSRARARSPTRPSAAHRARHRPVDVRRHRRRSGRRAWTSSTCSSSSTTIPTPHGVIMIGEIGGRPRSGRPRGSSEHEEAGRRVHRRRDGPAGQAHGPRRRDHRRRARARPRRRWPRSRPPASKVAATPAEMASTLTIPIAQLDTCPTRHHHGHSAHAQHHQARRSRKAAKWGPSSRGWRPRVSRLSA